MYRCQDLRRPKTSGLFEIASLSIVMYLAKSSAMPLSYSHSSVIIFYKKSQIQFHHRNSRKTHIVFMIKIRLTIWMRMHRPTRRQNFFLSATTMSQNSDNLVRWYTYVWGEMRLYVLKSICIAGTVNFAWENSSLNTVMLIIIARSERRALAWSTSCRSVLY